MFRIKLQSEVTMKRKRKDTYTEQASEFFFSGKFDGDEESLTKLAEEILFPVSKALIEIGEIHGLLAMDKIEMIEYYEYRHKCIEKQIDKLTKEIQSLHKRLSYYN